MLDPRFLFRKFCLAIYSAQLARAGRGADALQILRNRHLGYASLDWKRRISFPCRTIIDAGAHHGDVSATLAFTFRPEKLLAVEANPVLADNLRLRFASHPNIQIASVALAENEGVVPFFRHDFDAASSLYCLRDGYLASLGLSAGVSRIEVPARRLDDISAAAGFSTIDLLKLDCQGAELRILEGARNLLPRIRSVYIEVSFDPIYTHGALFHEVHAFLRKAGFQLTQLDSGISSRGNIDQADALYVRDHG